MAAQFNWFPGHMNKTLKEIEKRIPVVDLVIEVLDARAPFASQNLNFRKILKTKPVLYAIAKADLADPQVTKQWITTLTEQGNNIFIIDHNNKNIVKELIVAIEHSAKAKIDKDKARGFINSLINVLVIGIPNVGKSTLINKLIKDKSVKVGNKPGVTRGIQTLILNKYITLMDTPGVLPSKFASDNVAINLCGIYSIKEEVYPREEIAIKLMQNIYNHYSNLIEKKFRLANSFAKPISEEDCYIVFATIAQHNGWILAENTPDLERVMQAFIRDLANGEVGRVSFERPSEINLELVDLESK